MQVLSNSVQQTFLILPPAQGLYTQNYCLKAVLASQNFSHSSHSSATKTWQQQSVTWKIFASFLRICPLKTVINVLLYISDLIPSFMVVYIYSFPSHLIRGSQQTYYTLVIVWVLVSHFKEDVLIQYNQYTSLINQNSTVVRIQGWRILILSYSYLIFSSATLQASALVLRILCLCL